MQAFYTDSGQVKQSYVPTEFNFCTFYLGCNLLWLPLIITPFAYR